VDFDFSQEEQQVIRDIRQFIAREATPALLKESLANEHMNGGPEARKFFAKFAPKGWLTPSWPRQYGGLQSSEMITYIIRNEMAYAGLPIYFPAAYMGGPTILRFGSEQLKEKYLLRIARGEIEFALGYTEPSAGSDLMALKMHAEDKGDYFLVNGQKTFSSHSHLADYHWLAVRTDLNAPKHKGVSIMVVDLKSPGITIRPIMTMAGTRTNEVYYDNVKVPKEDLVGEKNLGFKYIMAALDFERMFAFGHYKKFYEDVVEYAKSTIVGGRPLSKDPLIRQKLAQFETEFEVLKLLYFQLAHLLDHEKIPNYQSSMEKTFFSELAQSVSNLAIDLMGLRGQVKEGDRRAPLDGTPNFFYRWSIIESIYGGSSEIQRNIIAQRGLGLPRA
jgi:alkylation response protein AidB-like acyl-CoA dehydrogenase